MDHAVKMFNLNYFGLFAAILINTLTFFCQEHLEGLRAALLDGRVALKNLAITKALTKDPSDYPDKKALPHVQV